MRILVIGANGFIGQATIRSLVNAGHTVRGLVRSEDKGGIVKAAGGTPVVGDLTNPSTLERALAGIETAVHLATASASTTPERWAETLSKVRIDGSRTLVAVARDAGTKRVILGSGYWVHGNVKGTTTEESPLHPVGDSKFNYQAERIVLDACRKGDVEGIVVRPGMIYGNGSWFRPMVESIRAGEYRYLGDGSQRWSVVDLGDVGEAYRVIAEKGKVGEAYLVVDDLPVSVKAYTSFIAGVVGGPTPQGMGYAAAVKIMGGDFARILSANQSCSNAKLRALGWVPRYKTYKEGIPVLLRNAHFAGP
jgi:nucleoside-diphosphate-sugar epimerase